VPAQATGPGLTTGRTLLNIYIIGDTDNKVGSGKYSAEITY
jgi:hypothetical protein